MQGLLCYHTKMNLQTTVPTYTVSERALGLYSITTDIFDWSENKDCVTPLTVAQKQFASCTTRGTVCIPGAGIGTYVVAALQAGFKPENIYAVEFNRSYFELGSAIYRRFGVNYVLADFLEWDPQMQFDVIIGNPPYQKGKYSDFYVCFIRRSAKLLREGGYFSMIAPAKGAQPLSRAQKPLQEVGWSRVEFGIESYFPNIETVIANYIGVKGRSTEKLEVVVEGKTIKVDRGTVFPLFAQDATAFDIVQKFFSFERKLPFTRKTVPTGKYIYVSRLIGTWHPGKDKGGPYAMRAFVNDAPEQNDGGFVEAKTTKDAECYKWVITRSLAMRFVVNQCVRATFIPPMFWELTPDILGCESDEDIFKALDFTESEITYLKNWEATTY
jgi:hypothetical protein